MTICGSMMMYSCEEENTVTPEATAGETEELTLIPRHLAAIRLNNGNTITFRSEVDGIVYEEDGSSEPLAELQNASMLERFLTLTDESVPVPEELITLEENQALVDRAIQRGLVTELNTEINAKVMTDNNTKVASSWCSGHSYYDTDASGQFYRTFNGYSWGIAGNTVYSSWKSGADKCKTVNFYFVNCSSTNTMFGETYYKNIWGNYKIQDVVKVGPSKSRFWSKTYTSKRNRRAFVSGYGSGTYGGYVLFKNY